MDWLRHDEVSEQDLPEWARADGEVLEGGAYGVVAHHAGLVLSRGRSRSVVSWDEVLVPIRLEAPARLLVACARRPPRTPWFEISGADVDRIERAVRARFEAVDQRGYRERRRARPVLPPDDVLAMILARRPLPGAVEIPAATPSVTRSAAIGGAVGGLTLGFYGLLAGPAGAAIGASVGALGGAGLMGGVETLRKRTAGRVLVLTPDAFVGGLDGHRVRAVPWAQVGRFTEGIDDRGAAALEVEGAEGGIVARVGARWFGAPLDVIIAVAEAYRQRATEPSR